ncbi:hypothetical protein L1281_001322 [Neisseria sp. HSC-16F19]|nr:DUF4298 domain-containing protein [Neisseria sp. HSC-16F19]MCP2040733.1 hypothetical protein [Neisseria sp. HSC-16F19]
MNPDINTEIRQTQALYREWCALQPRLQAAQADWQRAAEIMAALDGFYFHGGFSRAREAVEQGHAQAAPAENEYSVLGEDTLWNAHIDFQQLAWQRLRSAVAVLDPEQS